MKQGKKSLARNELQGILPLPMLPLIMVPTTAAISPSPKKKKSVSRLVGSQLVSSVALPSLKNMKCVTVLLFPEK
jgi:hypothetical protein